MQFPRYFEITNLALILLFRCSCSESESSGTGSNIANDNRKKDLNTPGGLEEKATSVQKINTPKNLSSSKDSDEIYCFENGLFRCPKDKKLLNLHHHSTSV